MPLYTRTCRECGRPFPGGPRAWYCPTCREDRKKRQHLEYLARKKDGENRGLGSTDRCEICGREYIVRGGGQRYCPECAPCVVSEVDRAQGMEWYEKNKERVNPQRNARRRDKAKHLKVCRICHTFFYDSGPGVCCSARCRGELLRLQRACADAKRYGHQMPTVPPPPKKLDWADIDWDKPLAEIAEATGRKYASCWAARKRARE